MPWIWWHWSVINIDLSKSYTSRYLTKNKNKNQDFQNQLYFFNKRKKKTNNPKIHEGRWEIYPTSTMGITKVDPDEQKYKRKYSYKYLGKERVHHEEANHLAKSHISSNPQTFIIWRSLILQLQKNGLDCIGPFVILYFGNKLLINQKSSSFSVTHISYHGTSYNVINVSSWSPSQSHTCCSAVYGY